MQISPEVAEEQLQRLFEHYDIDINDWAPQARAGVNQALAVIKRAITRGRLEFEFADGTYVIRQTISAPQDGAPNPIVYHETDGNCKFALKDDMDAYVRAFTLMAAKAREPVAMLRKLKGKDHILTEALGVLFLQL